MPVFGEISFREPVWRDLGELSFVDPDFRELSENHWVERCPKKCPKVSKKRDSKSSFMIWRQEKKIKGCFSLKAALNAV